MDDKLIQVLIEAVVMCSEDFFLNNERELEEHGGIITQDAHGEYFFTLIANELTGTDAAEHLWTADRNAFSQLLYATKKTGGRIAGSFHTHPQFPAFPSQVDLTQLFMSFKTNYIYSPTYKQLFEYSYTENSTIPAMINRSYLLSHNGQNN